jgi:aspartokinase-like uncharacterized kinase
METFKLPRSSYDELCSIIIAYGRLEKNPSALDGVSQASGINRTIISGNHAFLSAVGIIEGGKTKTVTEKGSGLAHAIEHSIADEIPKAWRSIIKDNEFLNKMALAVRIRKGMENSSLEAHIAYSAGQPKAKYVTTGAKTIIEILLKSELVKKEDDRIIPTEITADDLSVQVLKETPIPPTQVVTKIKSIIREGIVLNIDVRIDVKPEELEGLSEKLKNLIKNLLEEENLTVIDPKK